MQEKAAAYRGPQAKIKSVLVSINRYYQNSFTDADKQKAIDLFLGVFKPTPDGPHLWEADADSHQLRRPSLAENESEGGDEGEDSGVPAERRGKRDLWQQRGGAAKESWARLAMRHFYLGPEPEVQVPPGSIQCLFVSVSMLVSLWHVGTAVWLGAHLFALLSTSRSC